MKAAVFGANGGIGNALVKILLASKVYETVFAVSRTGDGPEGSHPLIATTYDDETLGEIGVEIAKAGDLTLCICAIGILSDGNELQPERTYRQQKRQGFERIFETNVIVPALIAKHMLPLMPKNERALFAALSARVGSISDNRLGGWHAYRSSKAALNMLIKNYAIEMARGNPHFVAVGLHPGTVDTHLSEPFQGNIPAKQLFTPDQSAKYLLEVVDGLGPESSGKVFDWAGKEIPA